MMLGVLFKRCATSVWGSGVTDLTTAMRDFKFATVTSEGYVDQTAGLLLNLRDVHPDIGLIVCALDDQSYQAFAAIDDGLEVVHAREVWGEDHWDNLHARMNRPERAFATKSALALWTLQQDASGVLVLDSDLLFLSATQDLVDTALSHDVLLVAARHSLRYWQKSHIFGLFSAGIVGFSRKGLPAAKAWKALCFDETRAAPSAGLFNEQKYLDYLVGFFDVAVIRDPGINVSPTVLQIVKPQLDADKVWRAKDGTPIRIFHYSRSTASDLPFAKAKSDYNERGLRHVYGEPSAGSKASEGPSRAGGGSGLSSIIRRIGVGRLYMGIEKVMTAFPRLLFTWHRILTEPHRTFRERYRQAFREKARLKAELDATAFEFEADRS